MPIFATQTRPIPGVLQKFVTPQRRKRWGFFFAPVEASAAPVPEGFRGSLFRCTPPALFDIAPFCPFLGVFRDFWPQNVELYHQRRKRANLARLHAPAC